jgi:hypothetical protein
MFKLGALGGELFCDALDDSGDKTISLFDCGARLVDEADLRFVPPCTKLVEFVVGEKLSWQSVRKGLLWDESAGPFDVAWFLH